ncbi:MAG: hypothetical protein ACUX7D_00810 [Candidatus Methanodesulfokora washburnensis]|jgi:hypothetical protein
MPVRLRIEVRRRDLNEGVMLTALVNTGFTSEEPDILMPSNVAKTLGLWPQPDGSLSIIFTTAGGEVEGYEVPQSVFVRVLAEDRASKEVLANALINPLTEDVLISDALAEELGIQILYPRRGIWKFSDEERARSSV